ALAFHREQPEGAPGGCLKVVAHLFGRQGENVALVVALPAAGLVLGGRLFGQQPLRGAVAAAAFTVATTGAKVVNPVTGHGVEPAAKRTAGWIVVEGRGGEGDGAEDFLGQVGGIGVLEAALPGEAVNERRVQGDELPPRFAVARIAN